MEKEPWMHTNSERTMNSEVDEYLNDTEKWREELTALSAIGPCYTT